MATTAQGSDIDRAKGWAKKFLADWKAGTGGGNGRGRNAAPRAPKATSAHMLSQRDSWPAHVRAMGEQPPASPPGDRPGGNGNLCLTHARRNLLILGPPRSEKTAGVLTPAILCHPGPVVSTSTKADVLRATGLVRARLGRVWHYSPDGGETPPGCHGASLVTDPAVCQVVIGDRSGQGHGRHLRAIQQRELGLLPHQGRGHDRCTAPCGRARRQADDVAAYGPSTVSGASSKRPRRSLIRASRPTPR